MKDFTNPKFPTIHIKLLSDETYLKHLEALLSHSKKTATDLYNYVPEKSSTDDKYLYGIFDDSKLIGVIDLIEDYPTNQVAFIHEFFISNDYLTNSLAETLYFALEKTAQETGLTSFELDNSLTELPLWDHVEFTNNRKNIS